MIRITYEDSLKLEYLVEYDKEFNLWWIVDQKNGLHQSFATEKEARGKIAEYLAIEAAAVKIMDRISFTLAKCMEECLDEMATLAVTGK
jgi:hypothetical protein